MPDFDTHAVRIAQDVRQHSIIHAATVRIQSRVRAMHCQRQLLHLQEAAISMAQVEAHRKKEEARALLNERLRAQYKLDWAKKQEQHCQQDNGAPVAKRKLRKKKPGKIRAFFLSSCRSDGLAEPARQVPPPAWPVPHIIPVRL